MNDDTPQPPVSRARHWLNSALLHGYRAARVYVVFVILVYIFQDLMLFRSLVVTEERSAQVAAHLNLTTYVGQTVWNNAAYTPLPGRCSPFAAAVTTVTSTSGVAPAALPAPGSRGTVIVAHGNARSALDGYVFSDALTRLGFQVILYEYPGYASNPGTPSEAGCVEPLRRLVREVAALGESKIYLFGQSLGCGVVCSTLRDKTLPVAGAILLQPWDALGTLADHHLFFLPCSYLVGDKFNSVANLANFAGPVVFAICEKDTTIPPRFSQRLFDSYLHQKLWLLIPGCDHNDWPAESDAAWWKAAADFIAPLSPSQPLSPHAASSIPNSPSQSKL